MPNVWRQVLAKLNLSDLPVYVLKENYELKKHNVSKRQVTEYNTEEKRNQDCLRTILCCNYKSKKHRFTKAGKTFNCRMTVETPHVLGIPHLFN